MNLQLQSKVSDQVSDLDVSDVKAVRFCPNNPRQFSLRLLLDDNSRASLLLPPSFAKDNDLNIFSNLRPLI